MDFAYATGVVLLFIGWFLALLPHALHQQAGLPEATPHDEHVIAGLLLVLAGLEVLVLNARRKKSREL